MERNTTSDSSGLFSRLEMNMVWILYISLLFSRREIRWASPGCSGGIASCSSSQEACPS